MGFYGLLTVVSAQLPTYAPPAGPILGPRVARRPAYHSPLWAPGTPYLSDWLGCGVPVEWARDAFGNPDGCACVCRGVGLYMLV